MNNRIKPNIAAYPFYQFNGPLRGGTAPGPKQEQQSFYRFKVPNSQHKYSVQPMNTLKGIHNVSIKGKGWSSKGINSRMPVRAKSRKEEMPKSIKEKIMNSSIDLINIDTEIESENQAPTEGVDGRPISRHLSPPNAVGLELPPQPMTPPDYSNSEDMFEMTWSHSIPIPFLKEEQREKPIQNRRNIVKKSKECLKAYRPITSTAWESENPVKLGRNRVSTAMPYSKHRNQSLQDFDIDPGMVPSRILSANRGGKRPLKMKSRNVPQSAKASAINLGSTLDPDFLNMFDNRI